MHLAPLPVDGLGIDFRDLDERAQRIAIYAKLCFISTTQEQIMADAKREAGETRASFAELKAAVAGAIQRLMDKLTQKDAEITSLKQQVADANDTVVDAAEAAALSDETQREMEAERDRLAQVGIDIVVPPPVEPVPSDGTETPPA